MNRMPRSRRSTGARPHSQSRGRPPPRPAQVLPGPPPPAIPALEKLRANRTDVLQFHTALGQAQLAAGDVRGALATLGKDRELAPRHAPVTMRYAEALMRSSRPKRAHEVLLDLFN